MIVDYTVEGAKQDIVVKFVPKYGFEVHHFSLIFPVTPVGQLFLP